MTARTLKPGSFITFEGGDGAGKSTQLQMLVDALAADNQVSVTREPGGTDTGVAIRELLLHSPKGSLSPKAEALLYAADRAHHVDTVVRPALGAGGVVIQDRYIDSSIAYQGAGRALDPAEIRAISEWASGGLWPDLTILLDIDPAVARARSARLRDAPDRIESEADEFRVRLRQGFLDLAAEDPDRFVVIDAALPRRVQHNRILAAVGDRLRAQNAVV